MRIVIERVEILNDEVLRAIHALEQNVDEGQRMPTDLLENLLPQPESRIFIARDEDEPNHPIVGYCFGLPQRIAPQTGVLKPDIIETTFYEPSGLTHLNYSQRGINALLRNALVNQARGDGYLFFACHHSDVVNQETLEKQIRDHGAGDKLYFLGRGLPPLGAPVPQQYMVIRLRQEQAPPKPSKPASRSPKQEPFNPFRPVHVPQPGNQPRPKC
jgi:GNAT superfamily N-acetyltransferase